MTIIEVLVALAIFATATGILLQTMTSSQRARRLEREQMLAMSAAQAALEELRNTPFAAVVRQYDPDPMNDVLGPGTAPGATFAVDGLDPTDDDADGICGEVVLPLTNTGTVVAPVWEVREDAGLAPLGMPRDLNADAIIDGLDHGGDYTILPVMVSVRWRGFGGDREIELFTALTRYEDAD